MYVFNGSKVQSAIKIEIAIEIEYCFSVELVEYRSN